MIGAVLAFLGSTYAAVLVKRFEAREAARARILRELLPRIWRPLFLVRSVEQSDHLAGALNELRWEAAIAGKTEAAFALRLNDIASDWHIELQKRRQDGDEADDDEADGDEVDRDETDSDEAGRDKADRLTVELSGDFELTCSQFHDYLVKRLGRAWWEPF